MNIIGKSECTASQMAQYLINLNPNAKSWALEYAQIYIEEGESEGVRGDGAWIQSCKESGNFKFTGGTAVTFDQNNFCGLGVTSKGMKGNSFDTPRLGIRAQIQHLKGYATTAPLKNPCIDPRYKYISKGCASRFEDLAGKWAVPGYDTSKASSLQDAMNKGIGYGFDIVAGIKKMKLIKVATGTVNQASQEGNKMAYTNSSLVTYTKISPNKTSPRNHVIDTITIHCMAGNLSVETCGNVFAPTSRKASSNYGIGSDGRIAMYVEEKDRSWCSSNAANDHRAVTIEVANDGGAPDWHVSDKAMASLINLVTDICKRNNIKELKWQGNKALIGQIDKQNMTVHRWFAAKACPGEYLYNKHSYIANEVNKALGISTNTSAPTQNSSSSRNYLMKGDKGEDVKILQENLNYMGYSCGNVDGNFGAKTDAALRKFQSTYKLVVDGKYGTNSKTKLESLVAAKKVNEPQQSVPTSSISVSSGKYIYNGIDYSLVFDPVYYTNKYSDLKRVFGTNATALFNHFVKFGMQEKRQASATFNLEVYKNNYGDLQKAFGNNYPEYYKHYIQFGEKEGRKAV